jgi:hypothetical protein
VPNTTAAQDDMACEEFRVLMGKFSSGITLRELSTVAELISALADIQPPSRDAKRSFRLMIGWFRARWAAVSRWLPLVHLRDEEDRVIDGTRELAEKRK